jgi:hypothetical protein
MELDDILQWMDDNNDVLASLQSTLALILKTNQKKKCGGSTPGRKEIYWNRLEGHE